MNKSRNRVDDYAMENGSDLMLSSGANLNSLAPYNFDCHAEGRFQTEPAFQDFRPEVAPTVITSFDQPRSIVVELDCYKVRPPAVQYLVEDRSITVAQFTRKIVEESTPCWLPFLCSCAIEKEGSDADIVLSYGDGYKTTAMMRYSKENVQVLGPKQDEIIINVFLEMSSERKDSSGVMLHPSDSFWKHLNCPGVQVFPRLKVCFKVPNYFPQDFSLVQRDQRKGNETNKVSTILIEFRKHKLERINLVLDKLSRVDTLSASKCKIGIRTIDGSVGNSKKLKPTNADVKGLNEDSNFQSKKNRSKRNDYSPKKVLIRQEASDEENENDVEDEQEVKDKEEDDCEVEDKKEVECEVEENKEDESESEVRNERKEEEDGNSKAKYEEVRKKSRVMSVDIVEEKRLESGMKKTGTAKSRIPKRTEKQVKNTSGTKVVEKISSMKKEKSKRISLSDDDNMENKSDGKNSSSNSENKSGGKRRWIIPGMTEEEKKEARRQKNRYHKMKKRLKNMKDDAEVAEIDPSPITADLMKPTNKRVWITPGMTEEEKKEAKKAKNRYHYNLSKAMKQKERTKSE